jgi:DNA-binding PadR family transcriptional regulator
MPPNSIDLDLFILALVQRGCATPYELKAKAGISIGSSAPVLARLAEARLLTKPKPGIRARSEFSITDLGRDRLESEWQELLADRPTDPDAILRIAYLAWALGRREATMKFMQAAAETLRDAAGIRRAETKQLQGARAAVGAEAFRWLKTSLEAARLEAQSTELKSLSEQIRKQKKK